MSITSANAVFILTIPGLYPATQIQGFASDEAFTTEAVEAGEFMMGVDGKLSAGFVFAMIPQTVTLQADSASNDLFETWWNTEKANLVKLKATATITLDTGKRYSMVDGYLRQIPPLPAVRKLLQPRAYGLTWRSSTVGPV